MSSCMPQGKFLFPSDYLRLNFQHRIFLMRHVYLEAWLHFKEVKTHFLSSIYMKLSLVVAKHRSHCSFKKVKKLKRSVKFCQMRYIEAPYLTWSYITLPSRAHVAYFTQTAYFCVTPRWWEGGAGCGISLPPSPPPI